MADKKTDKTEAETARPIARKEVVVVFPAVHAPHWLQGFVDFIREQGVVGLAVGLVLGVAAKSVVDSLVQNIFNPIIGLLYGGGDLSSKYACLKQNGGQCASKAKGEVGMQQRRRPGFTYWFPARRYGWGWGAPHTWQGWLVLDAYLAVLIASLFITMFGGGGNSLFGLAGIGLATVAFLFVCIKKGEPPRWRR